MYACTHTHTHTHVCMYTHTHMHACTPTYTHKHIVLRPWIPHLFCTWPWTLSWRHWCQCGSERTSHFQKSTQTQAVQCHTAFAATGKLACLHHGTRCNHSDSWKSVHFTALLNKTYAASVTVSVTNAEGIVKTTLMLQVSVWASLTLKVLLNNICAARITCWRTCWS